MKSWIKSKTVWINSLTLVVGVIGYVAGHDLIASNTEFVAMLVALQGGLNVALRFCTWKAIG